MTILLPEVATVGRMGSLSGLHNLEQFRRAAQRRLPGVLFDYVDGDAEDGQTRRANREAYQRLSLRQQVPTSPGRADLGVEVLGRKIDLPVLIAPCGMAALVHPDGPIGATRAANAAGTIAVLSTVAGTSARDLADAVDDPGWFQLYAPQGRDAAEALVDEVGRLGYSALVVTTDTAVLGRRERDLRHGVTMPMTFTPRNVTHLALQFGTKPAWLADTVAAQIRARRALKAGTSNRAAAKPGIPGMGASPFTWDDLAWLRERWAGPLVVKGLVTADDARRARDVGAQAVVVSNHGGRQLDGAPATVASLPAVVEAVGDDIEVLVDGGVRRGTDVIKALALGAKAVQIGRPWLYGLAVGGEAGVARVLALLRNEMINALALMDVAAARDLGAEHVMQAPR